jgi:AraC-like DNA-binding protein
MERVAARLGMPPRTLQRRLTVEGTSYNGLLDELRHELALRYLRQRELALAEVAFLLGFAEQSAFQRAFRRWTATSPAEWRRRER